MPPNLSPDTPLVEALTPREREILAQLAEHRSDREIADKLMLSLNTVKWYARQIYAKLGVDNRRMAVLRAQESGLLSEVAPQPALEPELPISLTPFVGRETELQHLHNSLTEGLNRLVTLVGPGGIGKTRLAAQVLYHLAEQKPPAFANGTYFVALAALQEWQMLVYAIAHAVGLAFQPDGGAPVKQLFGYLRHRRMLLVLDNFEHLITPESNQFLLDMLTQATHLKVLVTSRSQLKIHGEQVYPINGLDTPQSNVTRQQRDAHAVTGKYSALRLLDQCVRQLQPNLLPDEASLNAMIRICRAVSGMPLAIELAASWIEVLSLEEIAVEAARSLELLETDTQGIPERQRSLRAVCDYSWRFLTGPEQAAMQQMAVFRGGFDRAAAEAVAGVTSKTLLALVSKSWLRRGNDNRFNVHEWLRQYCAERLAQDPLLELAAWDRHSAYYCSLLSRQEAALKGAGQRAALDAIAADLANFVAGCRWAARHHPDRLAEAATSLGMFLQLAGDIPTGVQLLIELIEALPKTGEEEQGARANGLAHARLLTQVGQLTSMQGETEASERYLEQALALLDSPSLSSVDTRPERARIAREQGYNNYMSHPAVAIKRFTESYTLYQALDGREGMAAAQLGLGRAYRTSGAVEQARGVLLESLAYYEESGNVIRQSEALGALSSIAILQTHFAEAERFIRQSLSLMRETDRHQRSYVLGLLGWAQFNQGLLVEAEATLESAISMQHEDGNEWLATANRLRLSEVLLHQGRYEDVLMQVDTVNALANSRREVSILRGIMDYSQPWKYGAVALAEGRYAEAHQDLVQALAAWKPVAYSRYERSYIMGCLALALRALERRDEAWAYLADSLQDALQVRSYRGLFLAIAGSALREVDQGNVARALGLYTAVATQPLVSCSAWYADVAGKEIAAAASGLPVKLAASTRHSGEKADLWETGQVLADSMVA